MLNHGRINYGKTLVYMLFSSSEIADTHFMLEIPGNNIQTLKVGILAMGWHNFLQTLKVAFVAMDWPNLFQMHVS